VFEPSTPSRARWSLSAFVLLAIAACGGRTSGVAGSGSPSGAGSGGVSTGAFSGTSGMVSAMTSGSTSGTATSGTFVGSGVISGIVLGASGTMTSSGTVGISGPLGDAGPDSGTVLSAAPSAGCGKPLTVATGKWVSQPTGCASGTNNQGTAECQAIPPGSTVPATATSGSPEYRGWWVYVPTGYDASKPYTVIYSGAGCGDSDYFSAGEYGFPYYDVDNGQAILVGLDYDTYSDVPGCYDAREPTSNDLQFFPWLQDHIEQEFCVDTAREFLSAYGGVQDGTGLVNQISCVMPSKLRAQVTVAGGEVSAPGFPSLDYPGALAAACNPSPIAAFFVHDFGDTDDTYANEIATSCARILSQNGCAVTTCNPLDPTLTTPYEVPAGVTPPAQTKCVQFNGCPADYPVVFCVTYGQDHSDDQNWGVVTLFWDFVNRLDTVTCSAGTSTCSENSVLTCSPSGQRVDPSPCGPDKTCASGACVGVCGPGQTQCSGGSLQTCVGGQWQTSACAIGCHAGICDVCSAGQKQCTTDGSNAAQVCNPTGQWDTQADCGPNATCVGGACDGVCGPLQTQCTDAGDAVQTCNGSGQWVTALCEPGQACISQGFELLPADAGSDATAGETITDAGQLIVPIGPYTCF